MTKEEKTRAILEGRARLMTLEEILKLGEEKGIDISSFTPGEDNNNLFDEIFAGMHGFGEGMILQFGTPLRGKYKVDKKNIASSKNSIQLPCSDVIDTKRSFYTWDYKVIVVEEEEEQPDVHCFLATIELEGNSYSMFITDFDMESAKEQVIREFNPDKLDISVISSPGYARVTADEIPRPELSE